MLHQFISSMSPLLDFAHVAQPTKNLYSKGGVLLGTTLVGLCTTQVLALSNVVDVTPDAILHRTTEAIAQTINSSNPALIKAEKLLDKSDVSLPDGVYLYGESSELDQIGQTYMVFESRGGKIIGAFYMPHSEFDCFYGTRQGNELALTVINSYDGMTHTFALGIVENYPVASTSDRQPPGNGETNFSLEGLQAIANLSDLDRRLLATCKDNYQEQIW
jgi:hypothetical protein